MKPLYVFKAAVLVLSALYLTACGNGSTTTISTHLASAPTVTYSFPAAAATGVPLNTALNVVFSKAMDPATITTTTFTLAVTGGASVSGTVSYDATNRIAIFKPSSDLSPNTGYTATITNAAKDLYIVKPLNAKTFAKHFTFAFTTGNTKDTAVPAISTISPADTTITALTGTVSAVFSKAIDSRTLTTATFSLYNGTTPVPGNVIYNAADHIATFCPSANLTPNTIYTASLSSAITDTAGNPFAGKTWSFTTDSGLSSAYVTNLDSNSVVPFMINATNGNGVPNGVPITEKIFSPVSTTLTPSGQFLYTANKGSNTVAVFRTYSGGKIQAVQSSPFKTQSSPQTVAIDPAGHFAYVANSGSSTISLYTINPISGALTAAMTSTTPSIAKHFSTGLSPSSIAIDRSGHFAYVTNFASNTLSVYSIDSATGDLTVVSGSPYTTGSSPGAVVISPSDSFLFTANYTSENITVFKTNPLTGELTKVVGGGATTGKGAFALAIDPGGRFLYVANYGANTVSGYSINPTTGKLTALPGSPYKTGFAPRSISINPTGKLAYVANSTSNTISVYSIGSDGAFSFNTSFSSGGQTPFSIIVK